MRSSRAHAPAYQVCPSVDRAAFIVDQVRELDPGAVARRAIHATIVVISAIAPRLLQASACVSGGAGAMSDLRSSKP
jgi:hypothetical protein